MTEVISKDSEVPNSLTEVPSQKGVLELQETPTHQNSIILTLIEWFKKYFTQYGGIFLAILSSVLMTMYSAFFKMIRDDVDKSTIVIMRGLIQIIFMTLIILCVNNIGFKYKTANDNSSKKLKYMILFLVAIIGGFRFSLIFGALQWIPMANVHTILNGSPVLVMVFSHFILKDPCNVIRTLGTFGLVLGVILIFQPYNNHLLEEESLITGYCMAIAALILSALGSVLTKKISKNFDTTIIALFLGLAILAVGILSHVSETPSAKYIPSNAYLWFMSITVAFLGVIQQLCLIGALALDSAVKVTMFRSLQIIMSFTVQIAAFHETPNWEQILGTILIMATITMVTLENAILHLIERISDKCREFRLCRPTLEI